MTSKNILTKLFDILTISLILCTMSCMGKQSHDTKDMTIADNNFTGVDINLSTEFYDSVLNEIPKPEVIVLKETDEVIFAEIDKIIAKDENFFILDAFGAKTVVSFDKSGKALVRYGTIGQGPGEYVRPWDIDVTGECVYVLDSNTKKLLRFNKDGKFINERRIPFRAKGFKILNNGDILFSLLPDGEAKPQLCLTDSLLSKQTYYLNSRSEYVGGWTTNDIFRPLGKNMTNYYQAPLDTLYQIDQDGMITGGLVFNFGDRSVPELAKKDFISAREQGLMENSLMFANNPIKLANDLMIGTVLCNREQYTILFDPLKNKCGAWKCDPSKSVYGIIEPGTTDDNGNLVCYIDLEFIENAPDFSSLNDSIQEELKENNHLLLIYSFGN